MSEVLIFIEDEKPIKIKLPQEELKSVIDEETTSLLKSNMNFQLPTLSIESIKEVDNLFINSKIVLRLGDLRTSAIVPHIYPVVSRV